MQILQAVARKLSVSSTVDLDEVAEMTEGFSGADLQALLYNAHLDTIHSAIETAPDATLSKKDEAEKPLQYRVIGGNAGKVMSRAETTAFERRVSPAFARMYKTADGPSVASNSI